MASGRPIVAPPAANPRADQHGGGSIFTQQPLRPADGPAVLNLLGDVRRPFGAYWRAFVAPRPPLGTQRPGRRGWYVTQRRPEPPDVWSHLEERVWHGSTARWYPVFAVIDIDAPRNGYDAAMQVLEKHLGLTERVNCLPCTSPSWDKDRSFHVFIPVVYRGKHATLKLIHDILGPAVEAIRRQTGLQVELYPSPTRIFRWPLGRGQRPIQSGIPMYGETWEDALRELLDLDPYELFQNPYLPPPPRPLRRRTDDRAGKTRLGLEKWKKRELAEALLNGVLPDDVPHRYAAQTLLLQYWYRQNMPIENAVLVVFTWVKCVGRYILYDRSESIRMAVTTGNWRDIENHIRRQAKSIYGYYQALIIKSPKPGHYPDQIQFLEGFAGKEDILWIADTFRGNIRSQRRAFDLITYMRPRMELHDWIYIPYRQWQRIAPGPGGRRDYLDWREELERRGILESIHDYRHVPGDPGASYPKRFRVRGLKQRVEPLTADGRPVLDLIEAAVIVFGSRREAAEALGLPHTTAYRLFDLGFSLDRLCAGCGAVLENVHGNREFCSHACQMRYWRKHRTG